MTPQEQLVKTVAEAWGHADLQPLYAALDDNVVWKSAASSWNDKLRSGGTHEGRANVIALFSKVQTAFFNQGCTAKEIVSRGDVVWGLFDVRSSYAPTKDRNTARKDLAGEMVLRMRIRDGKIIEGQTFFDTAALLRELGSTA